MNTDQGLSKAEKVTYKSGIALAMHYILCGTPLQRLSSLIKGTELNNYTLPQHMASFLQDGQPNLQ